jgi:aminomethyltransferase
MEVSMIKTPLYERHLALGAKIIDFGGWAMPVQYTSVIEEHQTTRRKASLFDICHMGEIDIQGPQALALLQRVMSRNLQGQEAGQVMLSVMTTPQGGIIDDLTVYKMADDHYMVVTNAATKDKDFQWLLTQRETFGLSDIRITDITNNKGKLDLQGPFAASILQAATPAELKSLRYYHYLNTTVFEIPVILSRTGYTGEDGFELYAASERVPELWDRLLIAGAGSGLKPAGLGARDTLRLEAGMLLYGHDMCEAVTPYEVIYGWLVDKEKTFIGSDTLRKVRETGPDKKLVGFEMVDRGIAREGYLVYGDGGEIGKVTSGTYSPSLDKGIGFALIVSSWKEPGTELEIGIRGNRVKARVVRLPFYRKTTH